MGRVAPPLVDGKLVYVISAFGKLYGLEADNGKKVCDHDLPKEFEAKMPIWGISTTPMIEGEMVLVDVGGKSGHSLMAFDKKNGKIVWHSQTDQPGYSAPIAVTIGGVRQLIFFTGANLVSVAPKDGKLYWSQPWQTQFFVNAATPVFIPEDKIFISSGYEQGAGLFQIQANNGRATAQAVWMNKNMRNHVNSCVLADGHVYGFDENELKCLDWKSGEVKWKTGDYGKGSLMYADGKPIANTWQGIFPVLNTKDDGYAGSAPVGCFKPNGYGLYDMIGNVWEWTADIYRPGHLRESAVNPTGPDLVSLRLVTGLQVSRVIKGGSFLCGSNYCSRYRPAARQPQETDLSAAHLGFRTVLNRPKAAVSP
jgi:outer membrane protein assembly factor BamB